MGKPTKWFQGKIKKKPKEFRWRNNKKWRLNSNGNWNTLCKRDLCERYDVFQRECFSHAYADAIKVYKARAKKRRKIEACPPCQLQKLAVKTKVPRPSNETNRAPDHNWFQGKIDAEPKKYRWGLSDTNRDKKYLKSGGSWRILCSNKYYLTRVYEKSAFCNQCTWFQGKIDGEPELYRWSAISHSDKPRKRKKQGSTFWAFVCDTPKCLNAVTKGSHFCLECKDKYE